jgi:hypothetical protein
VVVREFFLTHTKISPIRRWYLEHWVVRMTWKINGLIEDGGTIFKMLFLSIISYFFCKKIPGNGVKEENRLTGTSIIWTYLYISNKLLGAIYYFFFTSPIPLTDIVHPYPFLSSLYIGFLYEKLLRNTRISCFSPMSVNSRSFWFTW